MDGTLTRAVHDFDAIRESLKLPVGLPILEALACLPEAEAAPKWRELGRIELELAERATASEGAEQLLTHLSERGVRLGIVTRNSHENATVTLRAAGLLRFFSPECVSTRDNAKPKPDPAGLIRLLDLLGRMAASSNCFPTTE
jgi:phosphoglycolate phosphatase-like HAD superfamily hydrolase